MGGQSTCMAGFFQLFLWGPWIFNWGQSQWCPLWENRSQFPSLRCVVFFQVPKIAFFAFFAVFGVFLVPKRLVRPTLAWKIQPRHHFFWIPWTQIHHPHSLFWPHQIHLGSERKYFWWKWVVWGIYPRSPPVWQDFSNFLFRGPKFLATASPVGALFKKISLSSLAWGMFF